MSGWAKVIGITACVFTLLALSFSTLLEMAIRSQMKLEEGGMMMKMWQYPPITINFKINFFHVLNPREAMNGAKVKVQEVGPYWFR